MTDNERKINRVREKQTDDGEEELTCDECGMSFDTKEKLQRHAEREKREKLRGSPIGDAILGMNEYRGQSYR